MRYIRTKDGHILEAGKTTDYGFVVMPKCEYARHFLEDDETELVPIIAQADTIEELCDRFVYQNELYKRFSLFKDEYIKCVDGSLLKDEDRVYLGYFKNIPSVEDKYLLKDEWQDVLGAIWTDKGLIYVAKMNDKGDLDLL